MGREEAGSHGKEGHGGPGGRVAFSIQLTPSTVFEC